MEATPFFSIVISIYNAGPYLKSCLYALRGQEYDNFEAICINDGSTDDSVEIYHACVDGDPRFSLIDSKENKGLPYRRNQGMTVSQGEYVLFFDADDYVSPNTLSMVKDAIDRDKSDIVVFGADSFPWKSWADEYLDTRNQTYISQSIQALMDEVGSRPFVWNKAYRRELLIANECRLDEAISIGEDHVFQFTVFPYAETISFLPEKLYHYRQDNPNSMMVKVLTSPEQDAIEHVRLVSSIFEQWSKRGLLASSQNADVLGNWMIEYVFDPLLSHVGDSLVDISREIIQWYDDPALQECALSPENEKRLKCLKSLEDTIPEEPHVSVIMPIYNAEKYLPQALDSLRRQTMAQFEVIMVDDGSSDSTVEIAEKYCRLDTRFNLIKQEHQYAGIARNRGMQRAKAPYFMFLDSDDFFDPNMMESAYQQIREYDADICVFSVRRFDHRINDFIGMEWSCNCEMVPRGQTFSLQTCKDNIFCFTTPAPWSKMYRAEFIKEKGLKFQGTRSANDMAFVLSALASADKVVTLDETLMTYRINDGTSLQSTQWKNPFSFYEALLHTREELMRLGIYEEARRAYQNFALDCCLYNLGTLDTEESFTALYAFLKETAFDELEISRKKKSDFYGYTENNYDRMRFIIRNPPRSYQLEYPEGTSAPLIKQPESIEKFDKLIDPIRQRMPGTIKAPLGRLYRRIKQR